jgi:ATP-dependent RNA helicase RhlE
MGQGIVRLGAVEYVVLDEADRMLDMGFIHDVRKIFSALPKERQTLLFSATMPREIAQLADAILRNPARVSVTPAQTAAETVSQQVYFVGKNDKRALLERVLNNGVTRAIVFTRTKHGANRVSDQLERAGIGSAAIHGNNSQNARERALEAFREGTTKVLVATDIAARGIDVDGISHVVNYDIPNIAETYVHRIGRTGRAGATGHAVSFCDPEERAYLNGIERLLQRKIPVEVTPAFPPSAAPAESDRRDARPPARGGSAARPAPAAGGAGGGRRSFRPRRRPINKDR